MFQSVEGLLTPGLIKQQKEQLKQTELENFAQADVNSLISHRTLFCDNFLIRLWRQFSLHEVTDLALIAVGGYGRREIFPLSDLDFLILTEQPMPADLAKKVEEFIQFVWDCGFDVGASVRTLEDCDSQGRADITIATNLLESRLLTGNETLFDKLSSIVGREDFWPRKTFFEAKIQEKKQRYQRYNNTSYNLEPDIKYNPGGLRDLHLIYWIALRHSNALSLEEILQSGFIYPEEYAELERNQQFLFKVRFALHLILKRYDNRLLFDRQVKVSELLGYQGEGNQGVETMMKAFFQSLQAISLASDILAKHYKEHFVDENGEEECQVLDDNFQMINNAIFLVREDCFVQQPDTILDLFSYLIIRPQAELHSSTLRLLHLALGQLNGYLSELPAAREKFLRLLTQPRGIERALIPMHKYGVLTAYIPEWKGIEGLMQFDLFHIYTVDEHTMRVLAKLETFLSEETAEAHPLCVKLFPSLPDRALIYIAALFHDIAKGRGGNHADLGAVDVGRFAAQHGFDCREIETMKWLVKQHLFMSVTAQRRDIHDPEVVMNFAAEVQNQVRLNYLVCLTVADICATNTTLWNSWKRSLFASLYQYTNQQFNQGMDNLLDNQEQEEQNKALALEILQSQGFTEDVQSLWKRCPGDYFLRNTPKELAWHAVLLAGVETELLVKISNRFSAGGTEVFIYCKDRPNLFLKVVAAIGNKKLSIHDAQIITSLDGYAFDSFIVTELDGSLLKFDRRRVLEKAIINSLNSNELTKLQGSENHKLQHFNVKTEVRFLNTEKTTHTEMELFTLDKAGLLADVSLVFSELNLSIQNAKITTIGEKAQDFFILTNAKGEALSERERQSLSEKLQARLD
ncbi:bifunctional uridylyltransferase/uridylyl-removing protein GlnD [[Mannheimia] succiniciproducens]|nr:bifunctional uridylyltransferase/uridylyl-removing protein GlnD [[Mannheimia] succiniciproducens]